MWKKISPIVVLYCCLAILVLTVLENRAELEDVISDSQQVDQIQIVEQKILDYYKINMQGHLEKRFEKKIAAQELQKEITAHESDLRRFRKILDLPEQEKIATQQFLYRKVGHLKNYILQTNIGLTAVAESFIEVYDKRKRNGKKMELLESLIGTSILERSIRNHIAQIQDERGAGFSFDDGIVKINLIGVPEDKKEYVHQAISQHLLLNAKVQEIQSEEYKIGSKNEQGKKIIYIDLMLHFNRSCSLIIYTYEEDYKKFILAHNPAGSQTPRSFLAGLERVGQDLIIGPRLIVEKHGPRLMFLDQEVDYSVTVSNKGNRFATEVIVTNIIPNEFEYISSQPEGEFYPAQDGKNAEVKWNVDEIAVQSEIKFVINLRGKKIGSFQSIARLTSSSNLPPELSTLEASSETTVIGIPAMHISSYDTKDPCEVGQETTYIIEIQNEGTSPSTNVAIENTLSSKMDFVSAQGSIGYEYNEAFKTVTFVPQYILNPGEKITYKITCRGVSEGFAKNSVRMNYDQFDQAIWDEEVTSIYANQKDDTIPAMHISTYDTKDPCEVGQQTTYVIEVENEGSSPAKKVVVKNKIPNEMKFISADSPTEYRYNENSQTIVFEPLDVVQPGEKFTYKITCEALVEGSAKNIAKTLYDQLNEEIINEEGTSVYR